MPKTITTIADLQPDARNANRGTPRGQGMVEGSLRKYGAGRSILADRNGQIIAGNKTLDAAAEINLPIRVIQSDGKELIVVQRTDLDLDQDKAARELAVADNRSSQVGLEWDSDVLAELAQEVDLSGFWHEDELAVLLSQVHEPGAGGDEFDTTPDDGPTRVQYGEIWQLGRHRLLCGDSTDKEIVLNFLDHVSIDMVWSDPPYGIAIVATNGPVGGGETYDIPFGGVKAAKRRGSIGTSTPFGSNGIRGTDRPANTIAAGRYYPVIGDDSTETAVKSYCICSEIMGDAIHIWWGANHYSDIFPASSCWIVWDKENTGDFADAELAWCSDKSAVRIFRHMWNGLMKASERGERRVHPTQKPIALAEWAFEKYGKGNDTIFDPFLGSGMSIIAAERTDRIVYGCELSPQYCDVILKRWEAETGLEAKRIEDGKQNKI